jgi:hypothetical protein
MAGGEGKGSIYLSTGLRARRRREKSRQGIESAEQVIIRTRTEKAALPFGKNPRAFGQNQPGRPRSNNVLRCSSWDGHYSLPRQTGRGQENPACSPTTTGSWTSICLPSPRSQTHTHTRQQHQLSRQLGRGMAGWRKGFDGARKANPFPGRRRIRARGVGWQHH